MTATRYLYLARHAQADPATGNLTGDGRRQAALLGDRLRVLEPDSLRHGPLARAAQSARLVAQRLPGLTPQPASEAGDYAPHVPTAPELPPEYADGVRAFVGAMPAAAREDGPELGRRALATLTGPADGDRDRRDIVITHAHLVGWLVVHALGAPGWRWVGMAPGNASLTVIRYTPGSPASVMAYNDMSHLGPDLRWTGFPPALRP